MQFMKMQILEIGLLILGAYMGGMLARRLRIGEIVGQIVGGMLVGPHFWEWVRRMFFGGDFFASHPGFRWLQEFYQGGGYQFYSETFGSFSFITFLFLGVIAFSLGEELHHDRLRKVGLKAAFIGVFQGVVTFGFLAVGFRLLFADTFSWTDVCIIGSIGIATAPVITFIMMNKFRIEGPLKNIMANIVVLADIMEVVIFSVFLTVAQSIMLYGRRPSTLALGSEIVKEIGLSILVAIGIFLVLKLAFIRRIERRRGERKVTLQKEDKTFLSTILFNQPTPSVEILLIIIGVVAIGIALAMHLGAPFLIAAVVAGYLIANFHHSAFFDSLKIDNVMTIFNLLFFGLIGASIHIESFTRTTLLFSFTYFILRAVGKTLGSWTGARLAGQDPKIVATLPRLMLPQAGMAAVEIVLVAAVLKDGNGLLIFNTILPALVLFELGGAYITEKTLARWKDYTFGEQQAFEEAAPGLVPALDIPKLLAGRVYELGFQTKEDILHKLIGFAALENVVPDEREAYRAIVEREKLGHVSTPGGLALPHSRIAGLRETAVYCALLKHPIRWNPEDQYDVSTVFLIFTPEDKPALHLKALQAISLFSRQTDFPGRLHALASSA